MNNYADELNKLIKKSILLDDVPIAAIVVKNNKVIGRGYNKKIVTNNVTDHAEIVAITQAAKKNKNWRLIDCELYTTMFPCPMCASAIQQSRIKTVYYYNECTDSNVKKISISILNNINLNHKCNIIKLYDKKLEKYVADFFNFKRSSNVSRETCESRKII